MSLLPPQITKVIEEFSKLPGIGPKSAERLTFHLLRSSKASPEALGKSLHELKIELKYCLNCQMVSLQEECSICADSTRDRTTILVVENPLDVVAFEKTSYKGLYHVLHGVLSPIDGMGPEQLKLKELIDRCSSGEGSGAGTDSGSLRLPSGQAGSIKEVIVATNPDVEGEATASYIHDQLKDKVEAVTRLAHGLPMGADIEFADQVTLREAVAGRRAL
ncbi:recombination protein RecR [Patescibacteria group bacterium]|nr:recombination protein RecR [Patescibacteria group bacterium]